ncbi:MAG: 16S rRNA (cytidine(1402)-2'-O)-methyltransferase, partial [bacterium]
EFTVVVAGAGENAKPALSAEADLRELLEGGMPPKSAVQIVARWHRINRRDVYQMMLGITGKR